MLISIVIPVYRGAGTVEALVERLVAALPPPLEVVLVNDASPDDSDRVCRELRQRYPRTVSYIRLSRNFGEHNAVMAGMHAATGDYVVVMDDDFQNPPEEVARLVEEARAGDFDVVYSYYERKHHHWFRNLGSGIHNRMASYLMKTPRDLYLSSFKCVNRFVVDEVIKYTGPFPYLDGLVLRCTRRIGTVKVRHDARAAGRSGYTLHKLVRLWLNMLVNFSVTPLRLSSLLGVAFSALGLVLAGFVIVEKLLYPDTPIGWPSIMVAVVMFSGIQLLLLGVLGEYLGALFLGQNQTPQFIVREAAVREPSDEEPA